MIPHAGMGLFVSPATFIILRPLSQASRHPAQAISAPPSEPESEAPMPCTAMTAPSVVRVRPDPQDRSATRVGVMTPSVPPSYPPSYPPLGTRSCSLCA